MSNVRWWENYLVRYFMPSVAGMVIIWWLDINTSGSITNYVSVFQLQKWKGFGTAHLIIWLLFGSLYCYIASYPILVFHATRVLDFEDGNRVPSVTGWVSYVYVLMFALLAYVITFSNCVWLAFIIVIVFWFIQIYRLCKVYSLKEFPGCHNASIAYAYSYQLSKRRSMNKKRKANLKADDSWPDDLIKSYKHLRENGNTAFILLLELALCPIFWVVLKNPKFVFGFPYTVHLILVLWISPSVLVYFLGQHLERQFSLFGVDGAIVDELERDRKKRKKK